LIFAVSTLHRSMGHSDFILRYSATGDGKTIRYSQYLLSEKVRSEGAHQ
jgi:hypothetical protein